MTSTTSTDLDGTDLAERLTPLRLSVGSHRRGSGKGCGWNIISWEQGDTTITDYPSSVARPLARLGHIVNDLICQHRTGTKLDLLCVECSGKVLDLAHATVGTAGTLGERQKFLWCAQMLDSQWGLTSLLPAGTDTWALRAVAHYLRTAAAGLPAGDAGQIARAVADQAIIGAAAGPGGGACLPWGLYESVSWATAVPATLARGVAMAASDACNHLFESAIVQAAATAARAAGNTSASREAGRLAFAWAATNAWHRIAGTTAGAAPANYGDAVAAMLTTPAYEPLTHPVTHASKAASPAWHWAALPGSPTVVEFTVGTEKFSAAVAAALTELKAKLTAANLSYGTLTLAAEGAAPIAFASSPASSSASELAAESADGEPEVCLV